MKLTPRQTLARLALAAGLLSLAPAPSLWAQGNTPMAPASTPAQVSTMVGEMISPKAARFFASAQARSAAHPSYALEREPGAIGTVAASWRVRPTFSTREGKATATVSIDAGTSLYGTGEVAGPLLRNGRTVVAWNTDAYGYDDSAQSLYKSHPWVLCVRSDGSAYGLLADTTYSCEIDTAASNANEVRFTADGPEFPLIVIQGSSPMVVVQELGRLTGLMPLPALWTVGYHQCRYSYYPEARVREIASGFRDRGIPCDVIWYDIDYYESFRVFTFDRGYFPDPKKLNADLLKDGFHNVWMINPGIKSREEPSPAEPPAAERAKEPKELQAARELEKNRFRALRDSGLSSKVYVQRSDGSVYEGEVWPGWCYFPDYTRPGVRAWWAPWYKDFMAQGVTGVWNDMNEPAIFNVKRKTMPLDNIHLGDPSMIKPDGSPQGEAGAKGDHARYHNVYGMMMVKGTREGIQAANPDKRPFVLSRATYMGGHRYHAGWSGDNSANWYHLESSVPMVLNMGLSGFSFYGPDIGGFAGDGDGALFERWLGVGALLPFSRGHTGKGNIDKEPWSFGPEIEETSRLALQRRYRFLPYIYTLYHEASTVGSPVARPVFFADPTDPALRSEDDAFLLGGDLLVVPQLVPDRSRVPVMPKGEWREVRFTPPSDGKNTSKGYDSDNPNLPKLYVRPGAIIPTRDDNVQWSGQKPLDHLYLLVNLDDRGEASGTLYEDAGDGYAYKQGAFRQTTFSAKRTGTSVSVRVSDTKGTMQRPARQITVRLLLSGSEVQTTGSESDAITIDLR